MTLIFTPIKANLQLSCSSNSEIMKTLLAVLFLIGASSSAKFPSHFTKCNRKSSDFSQCMPKAVADAMRQLNEPIKELGLPSLNPLEVQSLQIGAGTTAVHLEQNFRNVKIYGFTEVTCSKMEFDFEKKTISNECLYPEIRMEAHYNSSGKVLLLEVNGDGDSTITLEKVRIPVEYKAEEYEKNGKKHWKIVDTKLALIPERVRFKFDNLFNGDKLLGDNINQVINDNWKEVFEDGKGGYEEAFAQITQTVFNNVLSRVPIFDIFDG